MCLAPFGGIVILFAFGNAATTFAAMTQAGPALFRYGAFATSNTCDAITLSANKTDSFDSSQGSYPTTKQDAGGNIGTTFDSTIIAYTLVIHNGISVAVDPTQYHRTVNGQIVLEESGKAAIRPIPRPWY